MEKNEKAQVSVEYLLIVGFVTFIIMSIMGIAFFYSGTVKDKIKVTQINNYANKIISTSESVFYAGEPSKATVTVFLPDNVRSIEISTIDKTIYITFQSSSGTNIIGFSSDVPIEENPAAPLTSTQGQKRIQIKAEADRVVITQL